MKKLIRSIFTFTVLLILTSALNAQPIFVEQFDYPAGDTLTNHGWINHSGSDFFILIASGGLSWPGYPSTGNSIDITFGGGSREDVHQDLGAPITTGAAYVSFLVKVDSAEADNRYFFHLMPLLRLI